MSTRHRCVRLAAFLVLIPAVGACGGDAKAATPGGAVTFNSASRTSQGRVEGQYTYGDNDEAVGEHMAIAFAVRLPGSRMKCGNKPARQRQR